MSALPVVWLCGPPGVGKSTVGWQLFSRWASHGRTAGYIDIDQLSMRLPLGSAADAAARTKAANLASLLPNYAADGAQRIVVTGVASPVEVPVFDDAAGPIHWVRLTADRGELHHRFTQRDGSAAMLAEVDQHADALAASNFAALTVDTTSSTPLAVAALLDEAIRFPDPATRPQSSGQPGKVGRATGPRVVVLTGPRAVGTSSVGWELFMMIHHEVQTAFIDLAQIGFLNDGDDLTVRRHRLRAANLAAMVRTYLEDGCQLVIAGGPLLSGEERSIYAQALAPGSMSVTRLRAAQSQLQQRIHARTASSGGPHLAGDDLRGRPAAHAERVLEQALREAGELDTSDFADHVLDTSDLSATKAADMIRSLLRD